MTQIRFSALALSLVLYAVHCAPAPSRPPDSGPRIDAAGVFTERYAHSAMSRWKIRANAAGSDCAVLLVQTSIVLDDSMVEAMHYGAGNYDVYAGGAQQFSTERNFRAVAYKDVTGRVWRFGALTADEADHLTACR